MKIKDKARTIIIKGLTLHLKGTPLKRINSFYNLNFKKYLLDQKDISFVNFLTNVCIRNRGVIEAVLNKYIKKKLPISGISAKAGIILGVAQILFSKVPPHAAVNSTVNLYVGDLQKWRKLANAVLRKILREEVYLKKIREDLSLTVPSWLYKDWQQQFGKKNTIKILKIYQQEPRLDIIVKNKIDLWQKKLNGVRLGNSTIRIKHKGKIENLKGYKEGHWWVQDIAAQIPVLLMGNIKNRNIFDLCAAPGGKTAQMLNAGALVTALDISKERVLQLSNNIKRIGLSKNLKLKVKDVMQYNPNSKADIVLLDAPCSGTGTFRKNPDVVWIKNKKSVIQNASKQKKLLLKALSFLKKNGFLIYSNCSLQYEEGENLINDLCEKKIIYIDKISRTELIDYPKEIFNKGLIRTLPYMYNNGMDGFFVARVKKVI